MAQRYIETERLVLEELHTDDSQFIYELLNSEGWKKWIGERHIHSDKDAKDYILKINNMPSLKYWVVKRKEDRERIGIITLIKRDYLDGQDIGFAFLPEFSGKNYAYEATKPVLDKLLKRVDFPVMYAIVTPENKKSVNLLERLGLSFSENIVRDGETLSVYKTESDLSLIEAAIKKFFTAFTNNNKEPDLDILHEVCIKEVQIIKNTNGMRDIYNLENFIAPRAELLTSGKLTNFKEQETKSETRIERNIAQRISAYKKNGILNDSPFEEYGTKMFQLIKYQKIWKISSMIWDDNI
ncbi:hypothetical protein BAX94_14740 [Elizabethkingia meningoseptica]|uniref:GNAT family N-acetyltransferase n=1 Tax=Elizabethkingia meningoseptica TaxID=238 RepID=A0A1T3FD68_ELIME|nr:MULTISPECIES: GNAT family N-acetyltransferase [Elizabethkingia]AQX11090.1 hypothetical protein BBD35_01255 [Elizabethkingia meningoseptica]MBG0512417.1 GNAT family N-acetyltransferase [Elizabethkingia meningoseptica]MDE5435779.1 GNAT family N-acetyltransferase [Elizabethkingia meningoseptica]MDE5448229.1 GNAT family N-acetyltransferase [Elizabethkingia meningoseptica]MDE5472804.1 GNAT family N-acetyltransferase [Elizabethkingia meningoseptica]